MRAWDGGRFYRGAWHHYHHHREAGLVVILDKLYTFLAFFVFLPGVVLRREWRIYHIRI